VEKETVLCPTAACVKDNAARRIFSVAALDGQYMEEPLAGCSLSDGEKYTPGFCPIPECKKHSSAYDGVGAAE
jgi:hypothetical protein